MFDRIHRCILTGSGNAPLFNIWTYTLFVAINRNCQSRLAEILRTLNPELPIAAEQDERAALFLDAVDNRLKWNLFFRITPHPIALVDIHAPC